ncbi:hypothetical protein LXL04_027813 [Taraxacum kok-saghyz]
MLIHIYADKGQELFAINDGTGSICGTITSPHLEKIIPIDFISVQVEQEETQVLSLFAASNGSINVVAFIRSYVTWHQRIPTRILLFTKHINFNNLTFQSNKWTLLCPNINLKNENKHITTPSTNNQMKDKIDFTSAIPPTTSISLESFHTDRHELSLGLIPGHARIAIVASPSLTLRCTSDQMKPCPESVPSLCRAHSFRCCHTSFASFIVLGALLHNPIIAPQVLTIVVFSISQMNSLSSLPYCHLHLHSANLGYSESHNL